MPYFQFDSEIKLFYQISQPKKRLSPSPVFLLHGYSGHTQENNLVKLAKTLSENGFLVVRFDARGYGRSTGPARKHYRISNYLQDLLLLYKYLLSRRLYSKRSKIYVWGHSLGGLVATIFASQNPDLVSKLCLVSPPHFFPDIIKDKDKFQIWKNFGWYALYSKTYGFAPLPYDFVLDSQDYSAAKAAKSLVCPSMVILGPRDELIKPEFSLKIYEQIPAHLAYQVIISDLSHYYKLHPDQIQAVNYHVLRFFVNPV